jgi:hypothetical protein
MAKPNPFEKKSDKDKDEKPKEGEEDPKAKPEGDGDDDWNDGDDFSEGEPGEGEEGEEDGGLVPGEESDENGSIRGEGGNDKPDGKGKVHMRAEPHEDGEGHRVHFHDDVNADIPGGADYQHHVTEHSKHTAGHLIHKDSDPDKAEAHRHAANLHARIGNALHAGGDTMPRENGMDPLEAMQAMAEGEPGEEGELEEDGSEFPVGFDSEEWNDGDDATFPDQEEASPGEDLAGGDIPAKPDKLRNNPARDSKIEAKRKRGGKPAPKLVFGKSRDKLPGGRADKRKPSDFDASDLGDGTDHEMEHTNDRALAREIAMDHLAEDRDYYRKMVGKAKGGPYIGPRGGKWADAKHTIPWKEAPSWKERQAARGTKDVKTVVSTIRSLKGESTIGRIATHAGFHAAQAKAALEAAEKAGKIERVKRKGAEDGWKIAASKPKKAKPPKKLAARAAKGLKAAVDGVVPDGPHASFATVNSLDKKGLVEYGGHGSYVLTTKGRAALEDHLLAENIERGMWGKVPREHWPQEMKDKWKSLSKGQQSIIFKVADVEIGPTW